MRAIRAHAQEAPVIEWHGIAADELARTKRNHSRGRLIVYPLVQWGVTQAKALAYCKSKGFDWGGLYDKFNRVSCFCCPFKRISELRVMWEKYPNLWAEIKRLEDRSFRQFRSDYSVRDLEQKFETEKTA